MAAGLDRHHQFDLVVQVCGLGRIGNDGPVGDDGVGRLHEEEGRLTVGIGPHLARMGGIVAADAVDAAHRKRIAAHDGDGRLGPQGDGEGHDIGSQGWEAPEQLTRKPSTDQASNHPPCPAKPHRFHCRESATGRAPRSLPEPGNEDARSGGDRASEAPIREPARGRGNRRAGDRRQIGVDHFLTLQDGICMGANQYASRISGMHTISTVQFLLTNESHTRILSVHPIIHPKYGIHGD